MNTMRISRISQPRATAIAMLLVVAACVVFGLIAQDHVDPAATTACQGCMDFGLSSLSLRR